LARIALIAVLWSAVAQPAAAAQGAQDEYAAQWGPPLHSPLPRLEARDQSGALRTLADLTGEQGLLLFLSRSADW